MAGFLPSPPLPLKLKRTPRAALGGYYAWPTMVLWRSPVPGYPAHEEGKREEVGEEVCNDMRRGYVWAVDLTAHEGV